MACNCYQTYSGRSCGQNCGGTPGQNNLYFPDFVANSCCNPVCDPCDSNNYEGCNICNGGGNVRLSQNDFGNQNGCPCYGCCCRRCPWYCGCGCQFGCGCGNGCGNGTGCGCSSGEIQPR